MIMYGECIQGYSRVAPKWLIIYFYCVNVVYCVVYIAYLGLPHSTFFFIFLKVAAVKGWESLGLTT